MRREFPYNRLSEQGIPLLPLSNHTIFQITLSSTNFTFPSIINIFSFFVFRKWFAQKLPLNYYIV